MKYRLVAVDVDGTLLNSKKELSEYNKKMINQILAEGVVFSISTGRPLIATKKLSNNFNYDIPLILYNGACIITSKSNILIYKKNMSNEQANIIINIINNNNGTFCFWKNENLYVNRIDEYILKYIQISKIDPILIDNNVTIDNITKIIWFDENCKLKEYQKKLLFDLKDVNYFTSQPTFLEFVSSGISKATAMEKLGDYFNVQKDEMIAIGDGLNDLPMLEYAGLGIAMDNAEEELKEKAKYITLSNDLDGVGYAINKFIIQGE